MPESLLRPQVYPTLVELAMATMESPFWVTMLKAIFAGWLIALMVWLLRHDSRADRPDAVRVVVADGVDP